MFVSLCFSVRTRAVRLDGVAGQIRDEPHAGRHARSSAAQGGGGAGQETVKDRDRGRGELTRLMLCHLFCRALHVHE